MRKKTYCVTILLVSSSLFVSGCQTSQTNSPKVLAEFEYSGNTNHILVPVEFKGQIYQFALDTGAENTVFDICLKDKFKKHFPWPIPRTFKLTLADGRKTKGEIFPVPEAKIGPLKLEGFPFVFVTDMNNIIPGDIRDFLGFIGMDFLKKYIVQIDFDNKKVIFFKGKKEFDLFSMFKPKQNKHREWGEPIQLKTKLFSNQWYVNGRLLDRIEDDFLIDSGWDGMDVIDGNILKKVKPYVIKGVNDVNTKPYIVLPLSDDLKILEKFSVGKFEYKNKVFQKHFKSVLSLDFLSRHIVTFDFPNKIMYLKKGKNFNKQANIDITIHLTGFSINSESHVVIQVDPNQSAYEKGVQEGDLLININSRDVSNMDLVEFWKFMQLPIARGEKVPFTFKRDDETFTVEFDRRRIANKD